MFRTDSAGSRYRHKAAFENKGHEYYLNSWASLSIVLESGTWHCAALLERKFLGVPPVNCLLVSSEHLRAVINRPWGGNVYKMCCYLQAIDWTRGLHMCDRARCFVLGRDGGRAGEGHFYRCTCPWKSCLRVVYIAGPVNFILFHNLYKPEGNEKGGSSWKMNSNVGWEI